MVTNLKLKVSVLHVFCQYVEHTNHLGKNQDPVFSGLESDQKFIKKIELTTPSQQRLRKGTLTILDMAMIWVFLTCKGSLTSGVSGCLTM